MANWQKRICRDTLLSVLGLALRIPREYCAVYEKVPCYSDRLRQHLAEAEAEARIRVATGSPSGQHRIFITCTRCGREVPVGRYHQHYGKRSCNK